MEQRSKAPAIAIGFAAVALLVSVVAVFVILLRDPPKAAAPVATTKKGSDTASGSSTGSGSGSAAISNTTANIVDVTVTAAEVLRLKTTSNVRRASSSDGVTVNDDALRKSLNLEPDDTITAIGGRAIAREYDLYDAMLGLTMMETTTVYVEVTRASKPLLVRWKLDVSLRTAQRQNLGIGMSGMGDPTILSQIHKIDDLSSEVPRTAFSTITSSSATYLSSSMAGRMIPEIQGGDTIGAKFVSVATGSAWQRFGFRSDDIVKRVNGSLVKNIYDLAFQLGSNNRAGTVRVQITRDGDDEELTIEVK